MIEVKNIEQYDFDGSGLNYSLTAHGIREVDHSQGAIFTQKAHMVDPFAPDPGQIDIYDIALALGNTCRWAGHTEPYYSVAEHCIRMSELIPNEKLKLIALLHDAPEAYLTDIPRPFKHKIAGYKMAEEACLEAIIYTLCPWEVYNIPLCDEIKIWDNIMLFWERRDLLPDHPIWPKKAMVEFPDLRGEIMTNEEASEEYLYLFKNLTTK